MRAGFQRGQQSERLRDLRKFRRRRKAVEGEGENGVGVGGTAVRLMELGQRKRRAQFEASRLLASRNRDRGLKSFLRRGGASGVAIEQDFAADAVRFSFVPALTGPLSLGDHTIQGLQPGFDLACCRFNREQTAAKAC